MDRASYTDFFTLSDADLQKKLVHLQPFAGVKQITVENILNNDEASLSTYVLKKGTLWTDMLYAGWPGLNVVSERARDVLDAATGVQFYPVTILDKNFLDMNMNYYGMKILGKSGPLVNELSRQEVATRIPGGPTYIKKVGKYFTPGSWDGSDFFRPEGTLNIFITSKIKSMIEKHKLTNILVNPIVDVETF